MNQIIYKLENIIEANIIKRPSKYIKSPYVADITIDNSDKTYLAHTPSLGCCGLCETDSKIIVVKKQPNKTNKIPMNKAGLQCEYTVYCSKQWSKQMNKWVIIGIYPKLAEEIVENCLQQNLLQSLNNIKSYRRETVIQMGSDVDSRFDFTGIDYNGIPFIMEVKNVPLVKENSELISYFPDGYKKTPTGPVSERALKHINELSLISEKSKNNNKQIRCIMCYVIQRDDSVGFQPSEKDPYYKEAFYNAIEKGVEILIIQIKWNQLGEAEFVCDNLPIIK
jgi:DNA-binding sugar fermentation-stimulating protein